jgi:hypothetical protein
MKSAIGATPTPLFRFEKTNGRIPRILRVSASMIPRQRNLANLLPKIQVWWSLVRLGEESGQAEAISIGRISLTAKLILTLALAGG